MKTNKIVSLLIASIMSVSFLGCNKNDTTTTTKKQATPVKSESTLKVVAAIGHKEEIFKAFESDTGIKVEFLDISSGEVLSRARAQKGTPVADAWFGGGSDGFMAAGADGLLEKYISEEAKTIPDKYKDKEGYWTGMTLVTAGLVVNKDVCKEKNLEIPQTWAELTDPKYKDEILMPNPNISGTSYCIISTLLQNLGDEKGWKYFEDLNKNIPYYPQRGGEPPQKAIAGEVAIGISPLDGEQIVKGEKYNVANVFPSDGIPWTPAPVAIFKDAKNMDAAKKFVDWSLSKHGQEVIVKECPRFPTRPDVATPEIMKDVKEENLLNIDLPKAGKDREEILKNWKEKIKK